MFWLPILLRRNLVELLVTVGKGGIVKTKEAYQHVACTEQSVEVGIVTLVVWVPASIVLQRLLQVVLMIARLVLVLHTGVFIMEHARLLLLLRRRRAVGEECALRLRGLWIAGADARIQHLGIVLASVPEEVGGRSVLRLLCI